MPFHYARGVGAIALALSTPSTPQGKLQRRKGKRRRHKASHSPSPDSPPNGLSRSCKAGGRQGGEVHAPIGGRRTEHMLDHCRNRDTDKTLPLGVLAVTSLVLNPRNEWKKGKRKPTETERAANAFIILFPKHVWTRNCTRAWQPTPSPTHSRDDGPNFPPFRPAAQTRRPERPAS